MNSTTKQSSIEKQIAELQQMFKKDLPDKMSEIKHLWEGCCRFESDITSLETLHRMAHSLAGSGGTFGAVAVSTAARELEQRMKLLLTDTDSLLSSNNELQHEVKDLITQLNEAVDNWQPSKILYIQPVENADDRISNLIYLVDDDELLAADLIAKLEHVDFQVKYFTTVYAFEAACEVEMPAAIIMDMIFNESDVAGADVITRLKSKGLFCPPVIFISVRNDIEVRLAAARAGASRYFCKPLDVRKLGKTLDGLTSRVVTKPYRILIVDDDESLLQYYSTVLRDAKMEVETLSNPLQTLKTLEKFKPDIIVLDIYMPECSGLELAQVIRQDDAWALTPIMFLSTETELSRQLAAMNLGGDDFLMKPIAADHFISAVVARARRARWSNRLNKDLAEALRESEFQTITMNQHDIVSSADVRGVITSVNDEFCKISGYSSEELVGQNHRILKSNYHPASFYKNIWETISNGQVWHGTICNIKKNGEEYWVDSTIVPFLDEKGKPYKYVSARTDITSLVQSESRLERSQNFAGIGTWDWGLKDNNVYLSGIAKQLYGFSVGDNGINTEEYFNIVHPDDKVLVEDAITACLEQGDKFDVRHRVIWSDGSVHWMHESGDAVRDEKGQPIHMLGVVQDITEKVEAEIRQQGNNNILEQIAVGEPLEQVLEAVILHAENMQHGAIGSILLLDESGKYLERCVAPNLPDFYNEAINRLEIGIGVASCGESAFSGERVIVNDIMTHPNWVNFRSLAKKANLRSCWTEPFYSSTGKILGTFSIYHKEPTTPTAHNLEVSVELAQFAAIVVEKDKVQQALMAAKEEAEDANRSKSQFLSSMSHELRTPMNAIMGFGQLLTMETDPVLSESQKENVNEIVKAGSHLLELINEVLDLAKIEAGRIDLSLETVAVGEVVAEALQLITPLADKRGIEVSLTINNITVSLEQLVSENMAIRADRTRLRQVLLNLLSNAVKYNNENGKVIIACHAVENKPLRISISDTGEGMTEEQQQQLFTAFNRLGAETGEIEGTGIGLVITKNIVELMGGNVGVESQVGKGSTFWFELPNDKLLPEQRIDKNTFTSTPEPSLFDVLKHEHTVLYIEDNPANLRLVAQLLGRMSNVHMWSAHEPLLGLELAAEHKPDLILLDINLPGMDGFGVLKHLRQHEATRNTPIIAISANAMPRDIEKGLDAGFDEYITKPIDVKKLLEVVSKALNEGDKE